MINPFKNKKGLGRGLSSLIGDSNNKNIKNEIDISSIIPNKFQPRKNFEKESLEELSNSIKERGILQPLIVRKSEKDNDKFELIAGERRWQAAQMAGLHKVPVVIVVADDLKSLEFAIVENVQRKDLNPIEEAKGYKRLIDEFSYDQEKVSKFIGKSRAHVANSIRLLTLPSEVIKLIEEDKLSQGHAKILVSLENAYFLAKKIINKKLSVRQSENLVKLLKKRHKPKSIIKDSNIRDLENIIMNKIGLNVVIRNNKDYSGQIIFSYKNQDQLDHLIDVIKLNY
tara:strand:+ start:1732 stop:2583 length:852 start_codon:yes stop_codon:yes gene_type:complete